MISVHVVDASELVRRGLRDALSTTADLTLGGETASTTQGLADIRRLRPDLVVIDVDHEPVTALRLCGTITGGVPTTPVVASLRTSDRNRIRDAMLAGASGHFVVTDPLAHIIDRIRAAHATPPILGPDVAGDLFARVRAGAAGRRDPLESLTAREREILALLADGLDNRRIGDALHLSPKTVKNYVSAILHKLDMTSRTEAAVFAARAAAVDRDR